MRAASWFEGKLDCEWWIEDADDAARNYPGGDPPLTLLEQSTLLSLDGKVKGFGHFARTVRGVIAVDP
jgi:hypothetical protein